MADINMTQHLRSTMPLRPWFSSASSQDQTGAAGESLKHKCNTIFANSQQASSQWNTNSNMGEQWGSGTSSGHPATLATSMTVDTVAGSQGLRKPTGTAIDSSEEESSSKSSISKIIHVVKTDPAIKRLLVDALAENKSSVSNGISTGPSTILPGFSADDTNVSAESACATPECSANAHEDWGWASDRVNSNNLQGWACGQPAQASTNDQIKSSPSRFSGLRPVEVVVEGFIYYVHRSIYCRLFPVNSQGQGGWGHPQLTGISASNFEFVLEYLYSENPKNLKLSPVDLKNIETFASIRSSVIVLSAVFQARKAYVLSLDLLPQVAEIYECDYDVPQFREYFRKTLREELFRCLDDGEPTDSLVTRVTKYLQYSSRAMEDITQVLHGMWKTAASDAQVETFSDGKPCVHGCNCCEECGVNCIDCQASIDGKAAGEASGEAVESVCGNRAGESTPPDECISQPTSTCPYTGVLSTTASWQGTLLAHPAMPQPLSYSFDSCPRPPTGLASVGRIPSPTPLPASAKSNGGLTSDNLWTQADKWCTNNSGWQQTDRKLTPLQRASALARCVYHQLKENWEVTSAMVADDLGCTEQETRTALEELVDSGIVDWEFLDDGTRRYWKDATPPKSTVPEKPIDNIAQVPAHTENGWVAANMSVLARCVFHWMKQQVASCEGWLTRKWFGITEMTANLGCTAQEMQNAFDELLQAHLVDISWGGEDGNDDHTYRVRYGW